MQPISTWTSSSVNLQIANGVVWKAFDLHTLICNPEHLNQVRVIAHARYTVFQMAEVAVPRDLFRRMLDLINGLRPGRVARC